MPSKIDRYKLPRKHDKRYKTTERDVDKMKELYHLGFSQKSIADIFDVSQSTVSYAVSDRAKYNLTEYNKRRSVKQRTKAEAREYSKALRNRKKELLEQNEIKENEYE